MRALIFALIIPLCGFGSCSRQLVKPEIQTVTQRVVVAVPPELSRDEPVPPLRDGTVLSREEQRLRLLDLVETLRYRMGLIRGLPHDRP